MQEYPEICIIRFDISNTQVNEKSVMIQISDWDVVSRVMIVNEGR